MLSCKTQPFHQKYLRNCGKGENRKLLQNRVIKSHQSIINCSNNFHQIRQFQKYQRKGRAQIFGQSLGNLIYELGATSTIEVGNILTRDALYVSLVWIATGFFLKLLEKWSRAVGQRAKELEESVNQAEVQERPIVTLLSALCDPLRFFLPVVAVLQTAFIGIRTLEHVKSADLFPTWLSTTIEKLLLAMQSVESATVKFFGILWVVFGVWILLRLRSSIITRAIFVLGAESKEKQESIRRALLPVGALSGWVMMGVGTLLCLDVLGINLQPVIASLGVGSLLIGYAAQSTLSNLLGGVGIFLAQPFVPGDLLRIIGEKGELLARGTVLEVKPMRTMLKGEAGEIFYVPNSQLIQLILANESPLLGTVVSSTVTPRNTQRRISQDFQIRNYDVAQQIADKAEQMLDDISVIDNNLPKGAAITSVNEESHAILSVWAYSKPNLDDKQLVKLKQQIVLNVGKIIQKETATLATA